MPLLYWIVLSSLLAGMFLSVKAGKLTPTGALTGGILGFAIFLGAGLAGLVMLGVFFVVGSLVTSWKIRDKIQVGLAEPNKGQRKASQAMANAGVAGLLGLSAWLYPAKAELFQLMIAASFSSAMADTCSSELGNVYGRHFYNILTFRPDSRGLNGVVSVEGTLWGLLGSCIMGIIYSVSFGLSWHILWILIAGTVGNLSDSVLGATLERAGYLTNDAVNFLNTLLAALVVLLIYSVLQ